MRASLAIGRPSSSKRRFPVAPRNEYWEACWDTREEKSQWNGSHRAKRKIVAILRKATKATAYSRFDRVENVGARRKS